MSLLNTTLHQEHRLERYLGLTFSLFCPRRSQQREQTRDMIRYVISKLSPIVKKGAPLFKHLVSVHAHQQHRRKTDEQKFRALLDIQSRVMLDQHRALRVQAVLAKPLGR